MINFVFGILFTVVFLPILEVIIEAIQIRIEQYRVKCSVKIAEYNNEIAEINKGKNKQTIGFKASNDEGD